MKGKLIIRANFSFLPLSISYYDQVNFCVLISFELSRCVLPTISAGLKLITVFLSKVSMILSLKVNEREDKTSRALVC
jgi:hypothetical protein